MANKDKAKHAFGTSENLQNALDSGVIDAYDILFLDGDTEPKVGWIDKNGDVKIVKNETDLSGIEAQIATKANSEDVKTLESQLANKADASEIEALQTQMEAKVDSAEVKTMVDSAVETAIEQAVAIEVVEF